jgi:hypothetical protein
VKHRLTCIVVILALGMTAIAQSVSLQFDGSAFKVLGWTPSASPPNGGWSSIFRVYAGTGDVPPLLGAYAIEQQSLVFRPRYAIAAGVRYRAVFDAPGVRPPIERSFDGPARPTNASTHVDRVYPSAGVLPGNQLRLYIYFSAPMSRGEAERRIHLLDAGGKALPGIFLPGQELWDPNNRRLTMTFDPGRIKRDLTSNRSMGPPIVEGRRYTLLIDRDWPDANGLPMTGAFTKVFRGGPAVREPPDPKSWNLVAPPANSRDALVVRFGRPMNYALLQRMLKVSGPRGEVAGAIGVEREESEWRLTPQAPWAAGQYRLIIDTSLEDLAGNKIGEPFDIDVFDRVTERITATATSLVFEIRSARRP